MAKVVIPTICRGIPEYRLSGKIKFPVAFRQGQGNISCMQPLTGDKGTDKWIGIAPFAAHVGKIYPLSKQEQVISLLSERKNTKILLFGGGAKEIEVLAKWERQYPNVISTAGKLTLNSELALMSHHGRYVVYGLRQYASASLVNIPVVSIWGATHPYAGFMGWKQLPDNAVQVDLPCRPVPFSGINPVGARTMHVCKESLPKW